MGLSPFASPNALYARNEVDTKTLLMELIISKQCPNGDVSWTSFLLPSRRTAALSSTLLVLYSDVSKLHFHFSISETTTHPEDRRGYRRSN